VSQTGAGPGDERRAGEDHTGDVDYHEYETDDTSDDRIFRDDDDASYDRPRRRSRLRGCLPVLVVLVVLAGGAWYGGRVVIDQIGSRFASAPDYAGPGSGQVLYQVKQGASSTQIGRDLKAQGVVKSVDAFSEAATKDEKSRNIQVGYYELKKQMKASDALALLVDPANLMQSLVTVPEGARVSQITKTIVDKTDISRRAVTRALANPSAIGLPAAAKGNPEGYLFPATYTVPPKQTAVGLLKQMVAKTVATEESLDITTKAAKLGYTPEQILTLASILEYEASRDEDYPKVARAIYNRLDQGQALQSDATVAYANNKTGSLYTSDTERSLNSPYNTYKFKGLPPGPIGSPGQKTIEAALNPSSGKQLFWVVVNLKTGETKYADNYQDHLRNVEEFRAYCQTSEAC
jgi:UPF0755 protein